MLKNYIKVALRNLVKNKTFSSINILGLTLGFSCFVVISLFLLDELSFDSFHKDSSTTYRVIQEITELDGTSRELALIGPAIGQQAEEQFPEIIDQTQMIEIGRLTMGNEPLSRDYERIWIAESNFFEFFDFEFIHGDPSTALVEPDVLVLTESTASSILEEPMC